LLSEGRAIFKDTWATQGAEIIQIRPVNKIVSCIRSEPDKPDHSADLRGRPKPSKATFLSFAAALTLPAEGRRQKP